MIRCLNNACAQGAEPAHPVEVYPLMIRCGDFFVNGASWRCHRQKFPRSRLLTFILMCYDRMREKERIVKEFFSTSDSSILAKRQRLRRWLHRAHRELSSGLGEVKEEPFEEVPVDVDNRRYNFYYHPTDGDR